MGVKPDWPRKRLTRNTPITISDWPKEKRGANDGWEIMHKIKISNPKISLINCMGNQPNYPIKNTLEISDSGTNIHISKQATSTMAPYIIKNDMKARLTYGIKWSHHI